ncbi:MAG: hypothetical protein WB729_12655 [Candidatus Sulfotelmatobacter sp.]
MDTQKFSTWLAEMSVSERIRVLALIYSILTVNTRELFLPEATKGKEQVVLHMLQGINEIHHTLANWLGSYAMDAAKTFPVETLSQQLSQIASYYRVERWLTSAIERAHTIK